MNAMNTAKPYVDAGIIMWINGAACDRVPEGYRADPKRLYKGEDLLLYRYPDGSIGTAARLPEMVRDLRPHLPVIGRSFDWDPSEPGQEALFRSLWAYVNGEFTKVGEVRANLAHLPSVWGRMVGSFQEYGPKMYGARAVLEHMVNGAPLGDLLDEVLYKYLTGGGVTSDDLYRCQQATNRIRFLSFLCRINPCELTIPELIEVMAFAQVPAVYPFAKAAVARLGG